jgi:hypothetical protein
MFEWTETSAPQKRWFQQSVLLSYYVVGLIPYVFLDDDIHSVLRSTLPELDIQEMRRYCLQVLTRRLVAMPESWWLFQRYQPVRPSDLCIHFVDTHPLGLDDAANRLSVLVSMGAAYKLTDGRYRLSALGEEAANQYGRRSMLAGAAEDAERRTDTGEDELDFAELAIW